MMNNQSGLSRGRSGSLGLALLFMVIAVLGIVMTMNRTSHRSSLAMSDSAYVTSENAESPRSFGSYVVRTIVVTGMIIIILLLAMKYYKKRNVIDGAGRYHFEILGKRHLSPKQYLVMVRVEESKLLLGVTDHSINLIKEFAETDEDEKFEQSTPMSTTQSFIKLFKREAESGSEQEKECL